MRSEPEVLTGAIEVRVPAEQQGGGASGGHEWPWVFGDRDPADYDIGPEVDDCGRMEADLKRCLADRQEAREFVMDHWQSRRRGYVVVHFRCMDCDPVHHILIEPGSSGAWRIVIKFEDSRFGFSDRGTAFGVRYRLARAEEYTKGRSRMKLALVDRSGSEILAF